MTFLPKGYTAPKPSGNYFKLEKGANRFRIMSSAIVGYLYWTNDNKPVRSRHAFQSVPADARLEDGKFKPKHFWAFIVWNYEEILTSSSCLRCVSWIVGVAALPGAPL